MHNHTRNKREYISWSRFQMKLFMVYKCPSVIFNKHAVNIKTLSTKKCKVLAMVQKVIFPQKQLCSWSLLMILGILNIDLLLNVAFFVQLFL